MDSLLFAFRNIRRKRLRSLLTVAGIAIGVLSVVIVSIIGEVGKSAVNQELDSMGIGGLCLRATEENNDKYFTQSMLQAVSENENVLEVTPLLTKMALQAAGEIVPMDDAVKNRRKINLEKAAVTKK